MNHRALWDLDPEVAHLNHGSFGATPRIVLEAQAELRSEMEANPMQFLARNGPGMLHAARTRLARFVGAEPAQLVFVNNATAGANAVLRSFDFEPGDQILVTDHGYGAVTNAADYVARRSGAAVEVAHIPMPVAGQDKIVDAIVAAAGPRTKLAVVDHVTSPTAIVFPIAAIVAAMHARGVPVLIDGAHAPGMLDLDLRTIGADYYTANCHKWICAPKGSAFLWVRDPDEREIVPVVVGWGRTSRPAGSSQLHADFDWVGTDDPTAHLAVPVAIDHLGGLFLDGWAGLRSANHRLAIAGRNVLLDALDATAPVPDGMLGSMAIVPLPPGEPPGAAQPDQLQAKLADEGFEAPVTFGPGPTDRWLRISAQLYNTLDEYERLAAAALPA